MSEEEIQEYLKRVDELEEKLVGENKDTLQWLIFGYNMCAKMLNEKENIIKEAREYAEKHLEIEYFDYDILEANTIYNRDLYKVLKILDKGGNE